MASTNAVDEKLQLLNNKKSADHLITSEKTDKDENAGNQMNTMLTMMENLIQAMQQLQKMTTKEYSDSNKQLTQEPSLKNELSNEFNLPKKEKLPQSQAAILLQQLQTQMESTVAKLATSGRILKPETILSDKAQENKTAGNFELSTSEKWRHYTELVQMKDDPSKEYCIAKMRLGQELGLNFKETKREMLIGLFSNRLCTILFVKTHKNEDDLLEDIEEWEKIEKARSEVFKKYRNKNCKH